MKPSKKAIIKAIAEKQLSIYEQCHNQKWNEAQTVSSTIFIDESGINGDFLYEVNENTLTRNELLHVFEGGKIEVETDTFGKDAGKEFRIKY